MFAGTAALSVFLAIPIGMMAFNRFTAKQFNYLFFTKGTFLVAMLALGLYIFGTHSYHKAIDAGASTQNAWVLFGMAGSIAVLMTIRNILATDFVCGIGGSAAQLLVFWFIGVAGVVAALFFVGAVIVLSKVFKPVILIPVKRGASTNA